MYLDDKLTKEAYDEKYNEISRKLDKCEEEKAIFADCALSQKNIADKMKTIRTKLKDADVLDEFDRIIGLDRLKAIHMNDSKNPFESHKDRHEKIGEGSIGFDTMVKIINHPKLQGIPILLETPNELDGYKKEIHMLREAYTI